MILSVPNWPAVWAEVGSLGHLDIDNARVLLDHSLKNYPVGCQLFVKYHELGHIYYDTPITGRVMSYEMGCDEIAADNLVKAGYSRTQIESFMDLIIGDPVEKKKRINNIKKHLRWMSH